jgi:hypothetical protein
LNRLQIIEFLHTYRYKVWPALLVQGFCKLGAQLLSENLKVHSLKFTDVETFLNKFTSWPNVQKYYFWTATY